MLQATHRAKVKVHVLPQPPVCEVCRMPNPEECRFGHREDKVPYLRALSAGQFVDIANGLTPRSA